MDPITRSMFMGAAGAGDIGLRPGDALGGGYFAGYISHTADGVATHALIVAPAATGATGPGYTLTTSKQWQSAATTTGATSLYDGAANTALMTNSPAADFCTGLTIGGYSDWYLPARYELEIAYFNLKPTTNGNQTNYGINNYSVPKRLVNYTSGNPAQTYVTRFKSGNSEAFSSAITNHWSSTETAPTYADTIYFIIGASYNLVKTTSFAVRAFRKLAL